MRSRARQRRADDVIDIATVMLMAALAMRGYRRGLLTGLLSLLGFAVGAFAGLELGWTVAVLGLGLAGFVAGDLAARRVPGPAPRRLDRIGGAIVSASVAILALWLVAASLVASSPSWLARSVDDSVVLGTVDGVLPQQRAAVTAPTVTVLGDAPACHRELTGSGFLYAPERVLTNAHVVAGTASVSVQSHPARVVAIDPDRDLAVLAVPGLSTPVLRFATRRAAPTSTATVLSGPYGAKPARIGEQRDLTGPNIYGQGRTTRRVYTVQGALRPGDSGAPVLSPDASVLGIVFAVSGDTAFALTIDQAADLTQAGLTSVPVPPGPCATLH
jgi:S1-C subfamily serine protease